MNILTVVGARPQFVKAAALGRHLRARHSEYLVHTGQHYDDAMSEAFFRDLDIPRPDVNLGMGGGSHGAQTGAMLAGIEAIVVSRRPDAVLVYGDTNSTLAGALAAAKLQVPVVHVEAGLRSWNRAMPEEINRVLTDHVADILLCPSETAVANLRGEGVTRGVHLVGDVMAEALAYACERAGSAPPPGVDGDAPYYLATVHRAENTDDPARLARVLAALGALDRPVIFPVHPRTRLAIKAAGLELPPAVRPIDPVGYLDMARLERGARAILTDSGGVQKEAYWLGVPCVTLREETEWVETVAAGWNVLAGTDTARIVAAVASALAHPAERPDIYRGDGAPARCVAAIETLGGA